MADAGLVALVPVISPYRADRDRVRDAHRQADLAVRRGVRRHAARRLRAARSQGPLREGAGGRDHRHDRDRRSVRGAGRSPSCGWSPAISTQPSPRSSTTSAVRAAADVVIRLATPDDLSAVTALVAEFCDVDAHEFDVDRVERALRSLLADDSYGVVWLVVDDSGPAGHERNRLRRGHVGLCDRVGRPRRAARRDLHPRPRAWTRRRTARDDPRRLPPPRIGPDLPRDRATERARARLLRTPRLRGRPAPCG